MSFAERVATSPATRPSCWGDRRAYRADDDDCQECLSLTSCRQEVASQTRLYNITPSSPTVSRPATTGYRPAVSRQMDSDVMPNWTPGPVSETDNPFTRILKDMLMSAINGAFREGSRFTATYRMK